MMIYGIDPGLSTGIALFRDGEYVESWTTIQAVDGFVDWWVEHSPPKDALLVVEDYISDGSVNGRVWSSEVIGAIRVLHRGKIRFPLRSDKAGLMPGSEGARNAWIAERIPGLPDQHQKDAVAHALVHLKNMRNPAAIKRYWS